MTERFIDIKEVTKIVLYKRSAIYKFVAEGTFPKPTKLGPRKVGWALSEIMDWVEEKQREGKQGNPIS